MKGLLIGAAFGAVALCSVAAMASVGSTAQQDTHITPAQRATAIQNLDRMANPEKKAYTRVADMDGSCWYKVIGFPARCELGLESTCQSGMTVKEVFIAGGTCDPSENPWGGG